MQPHKFASNMQESLKRVPVEFRSPEVVHKVPGVLWDTATDQLMIIIKELHSENGPDTKRSFLEASAKIYDPLGLLALLTIRIKTQFQQVRTADAGKVKSAKSWDKPLPMFIQEQWDKLKNEIPTLGKV